MNDELNLFSRRKALKSISSGFGYLAFAAMAHEQARAQGKIDSAKRNPLAPKAPHFPARAKRVIFLSMRGAVLLSQVHRVRYSLTRDACFRGTPQSSSCSFRNFVLNASSLSSGCSTQVMVIISQAFFVLSSLLRTRAVRYRDSNQ